MKALFLTLAGIVTLVILFLMYTDLNSIGSGLSIYTKYGIDPYISGFGEDATLRANERVRQAIISHYTKLLPLIVVPLIVLAFVIDIFKSTAKVAGQASRVIKDSFDEGMNKKV